VEIIMTEFQAISPDLQGNRILKFVAFLYGVVAYFTFFVTFLYAIGFVGGMVVPKTIDTGSQSSAMQALVVNLLSMSLFAVQHSVMARKQFKQWWTAIRPEISRAQHLRAVRQPDTRSVVLEVASDAGSCLASR